jgi:hypothetical protein
MPITLNTVSYDNDGNVGTDKYVYKSASHAFDSKDILSLARTAPKPTSTFRGVARAEAKRTQTVTLDDGSFADAIITISCSLPVGMADADADALRDDMGDFALSTECQELFLNHKINT